MKRLIGRIGMGILLAAAVVWLVDGAVWGMRHKPMGSVLVTYFAVADLKGQKQEFYPDGSGPVPCSDSVFPRSGARPCWYVARHPYVFER